MPRHDFRCPACGHVEQDVYRPVTERASADPPLCPVCEADLGWAFVMEWVPAIGRMDAGSGASFVAFDQDIKQPDGSYKRVHVGSLHQLRGIERDSERAARNGEGEQLVWRDYSQSKSNGDVHSIMPVDPGQQLRQAIAAEQARLNSRAQISGKIHASSEVTLGPGVTESTASVFGD